MVKFVCASCSKELGLNDKVFHMKYEGQTNCLDCRNIENALNRGGYREGAGRPTIGTTRKVSITLPDDVWDQLDKARDGKPMSAMIRRIIMDGIWI